MQCDQFVGQVQNRAELASTGDAVAAIRATLETLAERLRGDMAHNIASQLPEEIGRYMEDSDEADTFTVTEFFEKVSEREPADLPVAIYHARVVFEVMKEAVTQGLFEKLAGQFPDEWPVFEAGSEGDLDLDL